MGTRTIGGGDDASALPAVSTVRPPGAGARAVLVLVGVVLTLAACWLPMTDESPRGWQVLLAVVASIAALVAGFARGALVVAAIAVVGTAALSLVDTDATLLGTSLAGAAAFAAFETVSLARVWAGAGVVDLRAERVHLRAIATRAAIGAAAAAVCTVVGLVQLPSPGLVAAVGVLAASVVIIGSALRVVGADPPSRPPQPTPPPPPARVAEPAGWSNTTHTDR